MIGYSQCWEDAELMIKALQINPLDRVLSITSGGCNALALALCGVESVYSVDQKLEQNYLLELKLAAIQNLDYHQVLEFLGYRPCSQRDEFYRLIRANLSEQAQKYWDENIKSIEKGVVHCGKFEKYLWAFRSIVLPLVHRKWKVKTLLSLTDCNEQAEFYNSYWNTSRWRLMFSIFFSRFVMSRRGRSREMFAHSQGLPAAQLFFIRTEQALKFGPVANNFYLSYVLLGTQSQLLPLYLHEESLAKSKLFQNLRIENSDILSFLKTQPDESISKFNLSDIFEPIDQQTANLIFAEILRTSKSDARIIFWNNLVHRDVPDYLSKFFVRETDTENELRKNDRVFFYDKFFIYTIKK